MRQMQFHSVQDESAALCKGDFESVEQPLHRLRSSAESWRVSDKSHKNLRYNLNLGNLVRFIYWFSNLQERCTSFASRMS
jgi:hypothetical protein